MSQALIAFMLLVQMFGSPSYLQRTAKSKGDKNRGWRAATYRGLTIGKSTRADMLRVLGEPQTSVPLAGQVKSRPSIWNDYGVIKDKLSGRLIVGIDSHNNRLIGISITPDNLYKEDVIKYFGNGYVVMKYEPCQVISGDEEVGPVYENPVSGNISYLEYRSGGISIHLDSRGKVKTIFFVSAPMGLASKEDCRDALEASGSKSERR